MSIESISSSLYTYSTSSLSSVYNNSLLSETASFNTSSYSSSSIDSYEISDEARSMASRQHAPDFDSMSDDEFRSHISEIEDKLTEQGFDVSDIENMSSEDLASLKDEMVAYGAENGPNGPADGKQGPPPPPPRDATSTTETSSLEELLLEALEDDETGLLASTLFQSDDE